MLFVWLSVGLPYNLTHVIGCQINIGLKLAGAKPTTVKRVNFAVIGRFHLIVSVND